MDKELLEVLRTNLKNVLQEVDQAKVDEVDEKFAITYAYDALGMCENQFSKDDVHRINKSKVLPEYSEREQKEMINHLNAYRFVKDMVSKKLPLTEESMKDIHEHLVQGIFQGGVYRNVNISIFGAAHQPPDYVKVYDRMSKFFQTLDFYEGNKLEKAIYAHASIAKIHPFVDANGRLAKLVLNYFLLESDYLAISIPRDHFEEYIACLEIFKVEKEIAPLVRFFKNLLIKRYENVLKELDI